MNKIILALTIILLLGASCAVKPRTDAECLKACYTEYGEVPKYNARTEAALNIAVDQACQARCNVINK
ncbi:MAG: hypothetical protein C3F02_04880 [Parcubacteria group bacterium]|nr:MAG: hypothetical protein C3F02_04880 [Parcubacteria group bacterium]